MAYILLKLIGCSQLKGQIWLRQIYGVDNIDKKSTYVKEG
jgi:hypothetical protein